MIKIDWPEKDCSQTIWQIGYVYIYDKYGILYMIPELVLQLWVTQIIYA